MKKLFMIGLLCLLTASFVLATVPCTSPGVNVGQNNGGSIVICDDPQDTTCEQDFAVLCPTDYHLCTANEYNAGNNQWDGIAPTWLLGEIQCRDANDDSGWSSGAGHFSIMSYNDIPFNVDQANNKYAGSSKAGCPSDYGCNEYMFHALCCYDGTGDNDGEEEVPEFGLIAGTVALIGAVGIFAYRRYR